MWAGSVLGTTPAVAGTRRRSSMAVTHGRCWSSTGDHGRGSGPVEWKEHGVEQKGSENIWIAVMGPDTAPLGERKQVAMLRAYPLRVTVGDRREEHEVG